MTLTLTPYQKKRKEKKEENNRSALWMTSLELMLKQNYTFWCRVPCKAVFRAIAGGLGRSVWVEC